MIVNADIGPAGRFGTQILQYAFLASYSAEHGCDFANVPWEGEAVFDVQPGRAAADLPDFPVLRETPNKPGTCPVRNPSGTLDGHRISGAFHDHGALHARQATVLQKHFAYSAQAAKQDQRLAEALSALDSPVVALHLRRGQDHGAGIRFRTPHLWTMLALADLRERVGAFRLVITSDDPHQLSEIYRAFDPLFARDLVPDPVLSGHVLDWQILRRAGTVLMSNSAFSFSACLLAQPDQVCLRPGLSRGGFGSCDPFAEQALLRDGRAEDFGSVFMSETAQRRLSYRIGRLVGRYTRDARLSGAQE